MKTNQLGKISIGTIVFVAVLGVVGYQVWMRFGKPYADAKNFKTSLATLSDFDRVNEGSPVVPFGQKPFRKGKVVVMTPRGFNTTAGKEVLPEIHPAYFRLSPELRASSPNEVGTVVHVVRQFTDGQNIVPPDAKDKKPVFVCPERIKIYNWENRQLIGSWLFDPGPPKKNMTKDEWKAMQKAVSPATIGKFINSLEER